MLVWRKSVYFQSCVIGLLISSLVFTGCPILSQPTGTTSGGTVQAGSITFYEDSSSGSPFSYLALDKNSGNRLALLADKDESGNPTGYKGAVFAEPDGKGWVVFLGEDGLPSKLINVDGTEADFANWTDKTVEVTKGHRTGAKAQESLTVSLDNAAIGQVAQLRESLTAKAGMSDAALGLNIAALLFSVCSAGVAAAGFDAALGIPALLAGISTFINLLLDKPSTFLTVSSIICLVASVGVLTNYTYSSEDTAALAVSALALVLSLIAAVLPAPSDDGSTGDEGAPEPPVLSSPENGASVEGTDVTVTWEVSEGATGYMCQISETSNFASPQTSETITDTTFTWTSLPDDGSTWYWRVRAQNENGWSAYSQPWAFVDGTEPIPEEVLPDELANVTPPPSNWKGIGTWKAHTIEEETGHDFYVTIKLKNDGTFTEDFLDGTETWGYAGNYYAYLDEQWLDLHVTSGHTGWGEEFPYCDCLTFSITGSTCTACESSAIEELSSPTYSEAAATRGQGVCLTFVRQ